MNAFYCDISCSLGGYDCLFIIVICTVKKPFQFIYISLHFSKYRDQCVIHIVYRQGNSVVLILKFELNIATVRTIFLIEHFRHSHRPPLTMNIDINLHNGCDTWFISLRLYIALTSDLLVRVINVLCLLTHGRPVFTTEWLTRLG